MEFDDDNYHDQVSILSFGLRTSYYFPVSESSFFKPYIISYEGYGIYSFHQYTWYEDEWGYQEYTSNSHEVSTFSGGGGFGADLIFGENFGMYIEVGYFTHGLINCGALLKF